MLYLKTNALLRHLSFLSNHYYKLKKQRQSILAKKKTKLPDQKVRESVSHSVPFICKIGYFFL
ncbi:MAG TPA: hypothetical protein DCL58_02575 [Synergistaceae bacterium]|nr:hypothetical protein [Synergistaceae bacterium]